MLVEFDGLVEYGDLPGGRLTPQQLLVREETGRRPVRARLARGRRVIELGGLAGTFRVTPPIQIAPEADGSQLGIGILANS